MTGQTTVVKPADRMLLKGLLRGGWLAHACCAVVDLGVPDLLGDGARECKDLAAAAGADDEALFRLLRALATVELVTEVPPRSFALTSAGHALRSDIPGSVYEEVRAFGRIALPLLAAMCPTARTGQAGPRLPGAAAALRAVRDEPAVLKELRLEELGTLAVLGEEDSVVTGGTVQLPKADAYVLADVLRRRGDEAAAALLRRVRAAVAPGTRLVLVEHLPCAEPGYHPAKVDDLLLLVLDEGRYRTEQQHRELLAAAGFAVETVRRPPVDQEDEAVVVAVAL